ncbi:MAG: hypothetical protein COB90_10320 [Hyphomicrobiales bacterium]|nr:MAG: hypothetical protein COB90_10320 [Hyphomicrobiales bacterium]
MKPGSQKKEKTGPKTDNNLEYYKTRCEMYESWLRAIDEHARFDVWFKDADSRYQFVNKFFERSIGRDRKDLINKTPEEVFGGDRAGRIIAMDNKVKAEGRLERCVPCDDAGFLEMHEEVRFAVNDASGNPVGLGCFAFETTEKSMTEEALSQAQKMAELGNWRWSVRDNCLISCSEQFATLLGVSLTEAFSLMQDRLKCLIHPDDVKKVEQLQSRLTDPDFGSYELEYRIVLNNGEERFVREIAEPMLGNSGQPVEYAGTLQDITRQKRIELELLQSREELECRIEQRTADLALLANTDALTGLPNRRFFGEEISRRFAENSGTGLAVVLIDLDGFKYVNDNYGHSVGDVLLQTVALRLSENSGEDVLVARLGGDEFGLAFQVSLDEGSQSSVDLCEFLHHALKAQIDIGALALHIDGSFGICILEGEGNKLEEGLKYADIALYRAKDSPNSIVVFEARMAEELAFNKQLEADLHKALDAGELRVAYQPQYSTDGQNLIGVEALTRWIHPKFGHISPEVFIKIAEECGMIDQLGAFVLDQACQDIGALMTLLDRNIRLSVNISTRQFYDGKLADKISAVLERRDFDPRLLELEITETVFAKNMKELGEQLKAIRFLGVCIALDDFGTGYSSLSYLRQFEVDRIKLDREFIMDIAWCVYDQRILHGIIRLAQSLQITTIAEGVEDAQQRDILMEYGCDEIQGFFYSRPLFIEQLREQFQEQGLKKTA